MLVLEIASLLPFAAAFLAAFLASSTMRHYRRGDRTAIFFLLLNLATILWSFFYGIELNLDPASALDVAPVGSAAYFIYVFEIIGLAAAPTYWFLFAAAYARKTTWIRGWRLKLAHVPFLYTVIVATTNPVHQLFVSQAGPGEPVGYGFLAYPNQLITFTLIAWGTWLIIAAVWRYGGSTNRRQAMWLGLATAMPFLGGLAWALRFPLNIPISINPVPELFALLNAVLLYQVLRAGFADLVPLAALQVYRTMSDAVIVVNEAGGLVSLNPAAERLLFGVQPGTPLSEASPEIAEHTDRFLAGTAEYAEFELAYEHAVYWGRIRRTRDSGRLPLGFIVLLTDVTDLRFAQADLVDLNEELKRRVRDLDEARSRAEARGEDLTVANRRLEEATKAKDRFLANMSHELRTPLNSIIGFSGILMGGSAGQVNNEQGKQLAMINTSGKRLLGLITDILDLARIESGKQAINLVDTDLGAVLESVVTAASPLCRDKDIELRLNTPGGRVSAVTDPNKIEQIVLNLVANAIKFTDEGQIVIDLVPDGENIDVSVRDTGIGIGEADKSRIFVEFEQVEHPDGRVAEGTGLGLSISRRFAHLLGGDIHVASEVGEGSTFTLTLPRV